jgi:concentrative nucleoside transporter, CNT family
MRGSIANYIRIARMQNLLSALGIFIFVGIAWVLSEDRKNFPWRVVAWGILLQFIFAFLVLWWEPGSRFFLKLNDVFNALLNFSRQGSSFVFGALGTNQTGDFPISMQEYLTRLGAESGDPVIQNAIRTGTVPGLFFAFQVLTTIIFFSALLSVLYYLGVMQKIVVLFARIMSHTMRVSGAESLSNSANIFVGQTEAPLVVRPFIEKMTRSELMAIMVGGFANTAGGVLGAYILMLVGYFPNIAAHLISASILSAPAAFIMAKVMVPEREEPLTRGEVKMEVPIEDANILDAAANGSTVGWQLTINVAAMLLTFVALIAMANVFVGWFGVFFRDISGLGQFNLVAIGVFLALAAVQKYGPPRDTVVWWALPALGGIYVLARTAMGPDVSRLLGLIGIAVWLSLFLQAGRKVGYGGRGWGTVLGITAAANTAYVVFGPMAPQTQLSLQGILGWLHWPVALAMGTPVKDCAVVGRLLGEKLVLTEFVAYADLAGHLGAATRGEVPALDPRSIVLVSYALSGFSNFASIAIQIGGISPLAPSRRGDIARLGLKAMVGGALASYMLACVAGAFYSGTSMLGIR